MVMRNSMGIKIGMVSLGCDKNTVDTEKLLGLLVDKGYEITNNPENADYIIINTCAFIESAKIESIDAIMEMAQYKKQNNCKIIVIGCLAQRYYDELKAELNEVDYIIKICDYKKIPEIIDKNNIISNVKSNNRLITTPYHYAYLKVSDGCNNKCTYCVIPKIRGTYKSITIEDLTNEAKRLIDTYNTKELILVAQDVTRYGIDLYNKFALLDLLDELEKLDIVWIRIMYCYPELVTDELIRRIASNGKVVKYLDIPLQHINDNILKLMNRKNNSKDTYNLLDRIRNIDENISIRSTFITGFPYENEQEHRELLDFIKYAEFDNCGFFTYSREEGTPASRMKCQINKKVKQRRLKELYDMQKKTLMNKYKNLIGQRYKVIYEGIDYNKQLFYGRTYKSAPDIDSRILFEGKKVPLPGDFMNIQISGYDNLDLYANIIDEQEII